RARPGGGGQDDLPGGAARLGRDDVVGLDAEARDVDAPAVDHEVAVADKLPRLRPRRGKTEPVDDVVETRLQSAQEVVPGHARAAGRLVVVIPELPLQQAVVAAGLLLLPPPPEGLRRLFSAPPPLPPPRGSAPPGPPLPP